MKTCKTALSVLLIFWCLCSFGQETKANKREQSYDSENLMDMQANFLTDLFGSDLSGTPDGQRLGYLEMLENSDLPEKEKQGLRRMYYLQSGHLTQKQKDSFSLALHKKMQKAMINNH